MLVFVLVIVTVFVLTLVCVNVCVRVSVYASVAYVGVSVYACGCVSNCDSVCVIVGLCSFSFLCWCLCCRQRCILYTILLYNEKVA